MVFNLTYNKEGKPYEVPDEAPQVGQSKPVEYRRFQEKTDRNDMVAEDGNSYGKETE